MIYNSLQYSSSAVNSCQGLFAGECYALTCLLGEAIILLTSVVATQ